MFDRGCRNFVRFGPMFVAGEIPVFFGFFLFFLEAMSMRQGWLQKKNSNGVFFMLWKKRYFKLTDKALTYAKSMTSLNLCEEVLR
jgi:hypothetical protein